MSYNFIICPLKDLLNQDIRFANPINKKKYHGIQLIFIINEIKKLFKSKVNKGEKKYKMNLLHKELSQFSHENITEDNNDNNSHELTTRSNSNFKSNFNDEQITFINYTHQVLCMYYRYS